MKADGDMAAPFQGDWRSHPDRAGHRRDDRGLGP